MPTYNPRYDDYEPTSIDDDNLSKAHAANRDRGAANRNLVLTLHNRGLKPAQIAEQARITLVSVYRHLRASGVSKRKIGRKAAALALLRSGVSVAEASARTGLTSGTIYVYAWEDRIARGVHVPSTPEERECRARAKAKALRGYVDPLLL